MLKKNILSLSLFNVALPKKGLDEFLDNSDSLWYSFNQYGKQNDLRTTQIFTIPKDKLDKQEIIRIKDETTFIFLKKNPIRVFIRTLSQIRKSSIILFNNESYSDIFLAFYSKIIGARVVMFFHNDKKPYDSKIPKFLLRFYRNRIVDAFLTNSLVIKNNYKKEIDRPIFIFTFGFDPKLFYPAERKLKPDLHLLYCGRISPEKKIEDIINGIAEARLRDKIFFTIVGEEADHEQRYLKKLKELLTSNSIRYSYEGYVSHSKLVHYYHQADLFVNLRPDEAFGKVFIEAMATGLAIIGKKNAPGPESLIVNNYNGFLIDSSSTLASLLDKLVDNLPHCRNIGENALKFVKAKFTIEKSYESFKLAYDALIAGSILDETFFKNKSFKTLRRIKRILLNQHIDRCNYTIDSGKVIPKEMYVLMNYCTGKGIDVGCGSNKTHPDAIGVDITPKGMLWKFGNQKGQRSVADVNTSGENLEMFKDGDLDYVVARHNLEHYIDPIKVLREWKRVVRIGGIIGIVIPDNTYCDTISLDPTHYHVFTPESFRNLVELIGGLKIIKLEVCVEDWSFVCIMEKIG